MFSDSGAAGTGPFVLAINCSTGAATGVAGAAGPLRPAAASRNTPQSNRDVIRLMTRLRYYDRCRLEGVEGGAGGRDDGNTSSECPPEVTEPCDHIVTIQPIEIILILLLFIFWAATIAVFLRKWRSIRIIQSGEPRFKHAPKNLETIKVVAKHRDSVIYNSYSDNMTKTLQARQKRFDRMNTMPNIKLGELIPLDPIAETHRCASVDIEPIPPLSLQRLHKGKERRNSTSSDGGAGAAGPQGGLKSLAAQSCTSIAISFHSATSNNVISPVMEEAVEELDDMTETVASISSAINKNGQAISPETYRNITTTAAIKSSELTNIEPEVSQIISPTISVEAHRMNSNNEHVLTCGKTEIKKCDSHPSSISHCQDGSTMIPINQFESNVQIIQTSSNLPDLNWSSMRVEPLAWTIPPDQGTSTASPDQAGFTTSPDRENGSGCHRMWEIIHTLRYIDETTPAVSFDSGGMTPTDKSDDNVVLNRSGNQLFSSATGRQDNATDDDMRDTMRDVMSDAEKPEDSPLVNVDVNLIPSYLSDLWRHDVNLYPSLNVTSSDQTTSPHCDVTQSETS